jgi:4-diphosphocytidyl-2-C-methyl-D-erythritol kinase
MDYGVKIGADVPFCVMGKTALAEGIGEILTEIPTLPDCVVAVAKPAVGVSTRLVYTELDSIMDKTSISGQVSVIHPDVDAMVAVLRKSQSGSAAPDTREQSDIVHRAAALMGNILENVTIPMHPEIAGIKQLMLENGAINAMMSGSGPTVYGIYDTVKAAEAAVGKIRAAGLATQTFVTRPI